MTKKLNEQTIKNELTDSAFFQKADSQIPAIDERSVSETESSPSNHDTVLPQNHDTVIPRNHDTVIPRTHDLFLEDIRKALIAFGKEAATYRFTPHEKRELANLIYQYKQSGIRTSENEITRIAINFIINDQKEFGEDSILELVLKMLNS